MEPLFKIYVKIRIITKKILWKIEYGNLLKYGTKFTFRNNVFLRSVGGVIEIGNNVFFNNGTSIAAKEKVEIGDNCIFGENVKIYDHNHVFKELRKPIMEQGFSTKAVYIGSNCWLGSNVVVLRGANIGDNCVIGAGCIVSGNIPCNSVVRQIPNHTIENRRDIQDE